MKKLRSHCVASELPLGKWDDHLPQSNYTEQPFLDSLMWARDWGHAGDVRAFLCAVEALG